MERGSLPIQQLASHRRDIEFMFHAAHALMKLVYTWLVYKSHDLA
jgi:hypothetical protein